MATKPTYVDIISEYYPEISVTAIDGYDYNSLVAGAGSVLPSKQDLDQKSTYILRKSVWKEIQAMRDYRKSAGVKIDTNWFHSDDTSRIQQLALTIMGANMPSNIMWKTMQGTFVSMTPTLAMQIFQRIAGSDQAIYGRAEFHRQTMILSAEPENYNFMTGWTMTYEESPEHAALVDYQ